MEELTTILFAITAVVCAVGWFGKTLACITLLYYMKTKGCAPPNDNEIKEYTREVVKLIFRKK